MISRRRIHSKTVYCENYILQLASNVISRPAAEKIPQCKVITTIILFNELWVGLKRKTIFPELSVLSKKRETRKPLQSLEKFGTQAVPTFLLFAHSTVGKIRLLGPLRTRRPILSNKGQHRSGHMLVSVVQNSLQACLATFLYRARRCGITASKIPNIFLSSVLGGRAA